MRNPSLGWFRSAAYPPNLKRARVCPWAASSPKNTPMMLTITITTGAMENRVKNASEPARANALLASQFLTADFSTASQ